MGHPTKTLTELQTQYLSRQIDTAHYLAELDNLNRHQRDTARKQAMAVGVSAVGIGVAAILVPEAILGVGLVALIAAIIGSQRNSH